MIKNKLENYASSYKKFLLSATVSLLKNFILHCDKTITARIINVEKEKERTTDEEIAGKYLEQWASCTVSSKHRQLNYKELGSSFSGLFVGSTRPTAKSSMFP